MSILVNLPRYFSAPLARESIVACWQIVSAEGVIDIDASRLVFLDPFGMALLAATLAK